MKRVVCIIICAILTLSLLAGCGAQTEAGSAAVSEVTSDNSTAPKGEAGESASAPAAEPTEQTYDDKPPQDEPPVAAVPAESVEKAVPIQLEYPIRVEAVSDEVLAEAFDKDDALPSIAAADLNVLNITGIIEEDFCPFKVFYGEKELYGFYNLYDAETLEEIDVPQTSGLLPQTWIFYDAQPGREYIITLLSEFPESREDLFLAFRALWQPE